MVSHMYFSCFQAARLNTDANYLPIPMWFFQDQMPTLSLTSVSGEARSLSGSHLS